MVEVDSYRYHADRATFESDRARDRELKRREIDVLRFTDRELASDGGAVARSVLAHLHRRMREAAGGGLRDAA